MLSNESIKSVNPASGHVVSVFCNDFNGFAIIIVFAPFEPAETLSFILLINDSNLKTLH